jgi:6-pyruvoyltetrahydropterin/6-carboxytetrahydropterin synthase
MADYTSTKIIELGSCAFRQWRAEGTHCRFVHGYRLMAKFWFGCSELDHRNWAVNFGGLKGLKKILQDQFDHTLCIAADDPLRGMFEDLNVAGGCRLKIMNNGVGIEKTAEWCFDAAARFLLDSGETRDRCWVSRVEVWEHEGNSGIYERYYRPGTPDLIDLSFLKKY